MWHASTKICVRRDAGCVCASPSKGIWSKPSSFPWKLLVRRFKFHFSGFQHKPRFHVAQKSTPSCFPANLCACHIRLWCLRTRNWYNAVPRDPPIGPLPSPLRISLKKFSNLTVNEKKLKVPRKKCVLKRRRNRLARNGTLGRLAVVAVAHIDAVRGRGHGEAQDAAVHLHHFVLLHFLVFALQMEEK